MASLALASTTSCSLAFNSIPSLNSRLLRSTPNRFPSLSKLSVAGKFPSAAGKFPSTTPFLSKSNVAGIIHMPVKPTGWLKMGKIAYWRNHILVTVLAFLGIAPKGVVDVHEMLYHTPHYLTQGGEIGICNPMHMILCKKPAQSEPSK